MAVRVLDGVDDEIRFPVVNLTGAFTAAQIYKPNADGAWHALLGNHTSGGSAKMAIEINTSNLALYGNDVGSVTSTTTMTAAKGWQLLAVTKAAGSATPRFHIYQFGTSAWVHENGGAALGDGATQAGGTIRFGEYQDVDDSNGKAAVLGEWTSALSDVQVEALVTNRRTSDWTGHAVAPAWVVEPGMNTPIDDLIGALDSNTINGTTIDSGDDPPGWTYGLQPASFDLVGRMSR